MSIIAAANVAYFFPSAPTPESAEWSGTPLGQSNVITKTKGRTQIHDKTIDEKPGRKEQLMDAVVAHLNNSGKSEPGYSHDVMVGGVRVRAHTNSEHLAKFWKENWYGINDWKKFSAPVPEEPQVRVYAFGGVRGQDEAAYYSRNSNMVAFFNTSYYGQLKSWVLGAVGRVLADEYGIHSIHGACVEKDGKGVLYIAPTGTGKSTSSYGLMEYPNTRFHSDDWVYVRYAYTTKDGKKVSPYQVLSNDGGLVTKGYRCFNLVETPPFAGLKVKGLTLDNSIVEIPVDDLDLSQPLEAYAYVSEKVFYLRCNLVESFPQSAHSILEANLENVPDLKPEFFDHHAATLSANLQSIRDSSPAAARARFDRLSNDEVKGTLGRLFAFDNARAMLNIANVLPENQIYANPLEPVKLSTVILLKRNREEDAVIQNLPLETFMERLLIGQTPQGTKEVAYNAYRAVPDAQERAFLDPIIQASKASGDPLYELYLNALKVPRSLEEEFKLFARMHEATRCYDLNTILEKDPAIPNRSAAVATTMKVIAKAMEVNAGDVRFDLSNYRSFIA